MGWRPSEWVLERKLEYTIFGGTTTWQKALYLE